MDRRPREQVFIWEETAEHRTVYELPIRMGDGLKWTMEIRCYEDGRTTMKVLKYPRSELRAKG